MDEKNYIKKYSPRIKQSDEIQSLMERGKYVLPYIPMQFAPKTLTRLSEAEIIHWCFSQQERLMKLY